jgi:hypothetical protein
MKAFQILAAAAALVGTAAIAQAQPKQNGFSVIILLGESQAASGGDSLPPAPGVRKAVNDVKDFLPYRSYRMIDSQWLRMGTTRMKGPDDQEYEVEVQDVDQLIPNYFTKKSGIVKIAFTLKEAGAASQPGEEYARSIAAADLEKQLAGLRQQMGTAQGAMIETMKARIASVEKNIRIARAKKLIDSTFEMEIGETVVVGTSRIGGGDKGLVVLLTSVAAGGK